MTKSTAELIKSYTSELEETQNRMKSLMEKANNENRTLAPEEDSEYDSLKQDVKAIEKHLERLHEQEEADAASATPIEGESKKTAKDDDTAKKSFSIYKTKTEEEAFKGQRFAQYAKAKAVATLDSMSLYEAAMYMYGKEKAEAIAKSMSSTRKAADPVVAADAAVGPAAQDFVALLRDGNVFDNVGFRSAQVGIPIVKQSVSSSGYWVGEGSDITSSKWALTTDTLAPKKVGGIVPVSIEAVRDSSVDADMAVMNDLAEAIREVVDTKLLSDDAATSAAPAGLRNGAQSITASGTDAAAVVADLKGLRNQFDERLHGKIELLMRPSLAQDIALMRTALNVPIFNGMGIDGGNLEGFPVRVSTAVPSGVIIAFIPSEYYAVLHGGVQIDVSREATIDDTSLFQAGLVGYRALRSVNWTARRTGTNLTAYIHTAAYGGTPTATD